LLRHLYATENVSPADHDPNGDPQRARCNQIDGDPFESGLMNSERIRPHQASPDTLTITRR